MRRRLLLLLAVLAAPVAAPVVPAPSADARPPDPQCIRECGPPTDIVERIIRTCQTAYCQFP